MKETNEQVVYVIRGTGGSPIDIVHGERLDDRRFALRYVENLDRWRIDHIVTGSAAFTAESQEKALHGFEKMLTEKGEAKLTEALEKANVAIREYEGGLA